MNEKTDYLLKALCCQFVLCLIISVAIIFGVKTNEALCDKLTNELAPLISHKLTADEAAEAFQAVKNIVYTDVERLTPSQNESGNDCSLEHTEPTSVNSGESVAVSANADSTEAVTASNSTQKSEETTDSITVTVASRGGIDITSDYLNEYPHVSNARYRVSGSLCAPLCGTVTSEFGVRLHPVYNTEGFHSGIDIGADTGDKIHSVGDGIVFRAGSDSWNGNYIEIDHGNGVTTLYCHCDSLLVKKWERVKCGEVIATVGSTGVSTGPHLHFEFRIDGVSYNPRYLLEKVSDAF